MDLHALLPTLRLRCPGVLDGLAIEQLKQAYAEFCLQSQCLQQATQFDTPGQSVTLTPSAGYRVLAIAYIDDDRQQPLTPGQDFQLQLTGAVTLQQSYQQITIAFSQTPAYPIADDLTFDEWLLSRWANAIVAGAAMHLRQMPNQPWSDLRLAQIDSHIMIDGYRQAYRERLEANDCRHAALPQRSFI